MRQAGSRSNAPTSGGKFMAREQLVVQLPVTESTDFNMLLYVEETLFRSFPRNDIAEVERHDFSDGRFNLFISPRGPHAPVIERILAALKLRGVDGTALIAARLESNGPYTVVWPEHHDSAFTL